MQADGAVLKKASTQTVRKLQAIWNKQNRATQAAESIKNPLGTLLVTPVTTRWCSTFDAVDRYNDILT